MVLRSGRQFKSFFDAYKRYKSDDFTIRSWTSPELRTRFLKGNPFGLTEANKEKSSITDYFVKDGVRYGVWFGADIYMKGAYLQQARKAKKLYKTVDVCIFVTAAEPNTTTQINSSRNKIKSDISSWNKLDTAPDIDHCLQAPLTEEEMNGDLQWVVHDKF